MHHLVRTLLLCLTLLASIAAAPLASAQPPDDDTVGFGMSAYAVAAQTNAGVKPDYGTFWIGPWTLSSGWGGPGAQMTDLRAQGVTPAIHYYYWGDDISPSCVENGCWSDLHNAWKDQAGWQQLAEELVQQLHARMKGDPVVIFMETEFNKGGIQSYEPFDGYLAEKARFLKEGYPAAEIVLAFGNWNSPAWSRFDRAAEASDYIGLQAMRGSTRDSLSHYRGLYAATAQGAEMLQTTFQKPVFILDIALSTHPEPEYLEHQRHVIAQFFQGLPRLKAAGVEAIVYRNWFDTPSMSTANYYGVAERHWGLAYPNGTAKPAAQAWIDGVQMERAGLTAQRAGAPVGPEGLTREAEKFQVRTAGGKSSDAKASGGVAWNLWSNGHLQQSFDFRDGEYDITVRARSTWAAGVGANMVVTLGGENVLATRTGTSYSDYTVRANLSGVQDLRLSFTNDRSTSTEDRNLLLDHVRITWIETPPVARIDTATDGLTATLDGSGSSHPYGHELTHAWHLGDGTNATGATVEHTYGDAGTYTVTLTVSDGRFHDTTHTQVTVIHPNRPPTASFRMENEHLRVGLDATGSSDPDGDPLRYTWDLGDGTLKSGATVEHHYADSGTYTVTLTVSDGEYSDHAERRVTAEHPNRAPTAHARVTGSHLDVQLDASASSDPDGDPLRYTWDLGDGTQLTGAKHSHRYAEAGDYTIRLTVSDGEYDHRTSHNHKATLPAFTPRFTVASGANEWWVEVYTSGSHAPVRVDVSVNGGAWTNLPTTDWGSWARSMKVKAGSEVAFQATDPYGQTARSPSQHWLGKPPEPAQAPAPAPQPFSAEFQVSPRVNEWWVEVTVKGSPEPVRVQARVDGGSWMNLPRTDWGSWARSFHAPAGSNVVFRATDGDGRTVTSEVYTWLAQPLTAEFHPKTQTNEWWVEVEVRNPSEEITRVQVRLADGSLIDLDATSWDSWAKKIHLQDEEIRIVATSASGATVTSPAYVWG